MDAKHNNFFNSNYDMINYLLLGNTAKHIDFDVTIKVDDNHDIVFSGNTNSMINANDYRQWMKS